MRTNNMKEIDKSKMREELKEFLPIEEPKEHSMSADVPIIFDGRQYSIRIPKKMAEALDLNLKNDRFHLEALIPQKYTKDNVPKLKGELKRYDNK